MWRYSRLTAEEWVQRDKEYVLEKLSSPPQSFIQRVKSEGNNGRSRTRNSFLNWNFRKRHFLPSTLLLQSPLLFEKEKASFSSPSHWIYTLIYSQGSANCISHTLARGFKAEIALNSICMCFPKLLTGRSLLAIYDGGRATWWAGGGGNSQASTCMCACWGQHTERVRDVITPSPSQFSSP